MKKQYVKPSIDMVEFKSSEDISYDQGFSSTRPGRQSLDTVADLNDSSAFQLP